ncbi:sigma-70 family RNA polymerase sigma factor [Actinoplanes sp. TRM 88003]|uniref:Sigma-70 family RNA polymerase sigma factor n=1 Tax=Paractinoplanes aksuensis TaxID=2939490 RepID=A0ABT1E2P5_9ACTN|nr:sigma-70 family RNA polymerase sigma factor [Actinoplanes aksuensis]MCO8277123.1 sigma-70 family RNA polymerase sigma factor [Actinoplanes aksuensis]
MSDELMVVRCQLGERDAFAELVRAWHGRVERYVARMLGRRDDDVVQEVWLAVVRGLPKLRQPDRFGPWLYAIARRAVMNRLRDAYAIPEPPPVDELPDEASAVVDRELVAGALAALPAREREVLLLFHLEDLSLDVCAQICAVPVGTVKSRLNRGRRLLRDELLRKGYEA